jgi:hypothetical protein
MPEIHRQFVASLSERMFGYGNAMRIFRLLLRSHTTSIDETLATHGSPLAVLKYLERWIFGR